MAPRHVFANRNRRLKVKLGGRRFSDDESNHSEPLVSEQLDDEPDLDVSKNYDMLANPRKVRSSRPKSKPTPSRRRKPLDIPESQFEVEADDDDMGEIMSQLNSRHDDGFETDYSQFTNPSHYDDMFGDDDEDEMMEMPPEQDDEEVKKELLKRLYYLQSKGEKIPKKMNMNNSREQVEEVYGNVMHARSMKSSVKMYKQLHFLLVGGIEKAALYLGKGKIRIKDWSDAVAANLDQYDPIYEEIFYEHGDLLQEMSPVVKLGILTIISGVVYHLNAPEEDTEDEMIDRLLEKIENNPVLMNRLAQRVGFVAPVAQQSVDTHYFDQQPVFTSQMPPQTAAYSQYSAPVTPRTSRKTTPATSRKSSRAPSPKPVKKSSAVSDPNPEPVDPKSNNPHTDFDYLRDPSPGEQLPVFGSVPTDDQANLLPYSEMDTVGSTENMGGGILASSVMMGTEPETEESNLTVSVSADDWNKKGKKKKVKAPKKTASEEGMIEL